VFDIFNELVNGGVALFGLFAKRFQDDGVEIAFESAASEGPAQGDTWPFRLLFANHPLDFQTRASCGAIRPAAREQLIQQDTQGIDVRRFGDRLSTHLLGAGVLQGHRTPLGSRDQRRLEEFRIQQLGDSEVQEPGHSILGDQNVARLEVAMNHQILVRVLHGRADTEEQLQAGTSRELVQAAILVDRNALHVIHHQVGQPVLSAAAIQQLHDIGVVQRGEGLPLVPKAMNDFGGVEAGPQHFDGHAHTELLVVALAQVHDSHSAFTQLANDLVCANSLPCQGGGIEGEPAGGGGIF